MKVVLLLLVLVYSGCSSVRWPDNVKIHIDDMVGVGNPDVDECQISFSGEMPAVPCEIRTEVSWDI